MPCLPTARWIVDIWCGVCVCHLVPIPMCGPIITASPDVIEEDFNSARITDLTIGFCGHIGVICSGDPIVWINDLLSARLTDCVVGCNVGVIVTGARTVYHGTTPGEDGQSDDGEVETK